MGLMRWSPRAALILVALCASFVLVASRAHYLWEARKDAFRHADETLADWAGTVREYSRQTFLMSELLIEQVDQRIRDEGGPDAVAGSEAFHAFLADLTRRSQGVYLLVVDRRGRPLAVSASFPAPDLDLSDRTWFRVHLGQGPRQTHLGEALHSRITEEVLFTVSRPWVGPSGAVEAVIQASVKTDFFQNVSLGGSLGPDATVGLWKESGELMARTNIAPADVRQTIRSPTVAALPAERPEGGFVTTSVVDGVVRRVSYRRLEGWPAIVTASIPEEKVLEAWRAEVALSAVVIAAALALVALLTFSAYRSSRREAELARSLAAALDQKELLIREIHHRVKNNLQMVSSFIRMKFRHARGRPAEELVADVDLRMRTIALLHETLYGQGLDGRVDARDYLRAVIDAAGAAHPDPRIVTTFSADGPPVPLTLDQAMPLGLLLTELVSNSYKHAFPSGGGGEVRVGLRRDGDAAVVEVSDDGAGFDPAAARKGLGTQLITAFARQLGGTAGFLPGQGTRFELRFGLQA